MKKVIIQFKILIIFILVLAFGFLKAQDQAVPFCENVRIIDSEIGRKINYFKTYKDFQQATLSKTEDGHFLIVTYKVDGIFQVDKRAISEDEIQMICEEINLMSSKIELREEDISQEARRRLIVSSATYSLCFYGWAIPAALGADEFKPYIASYLLIGGGGFYIPLIATRDKVVTNGMANAYSMGAGMGIAHGLALSLLFMGDDLEYKPTLGLTVAASLGESFVGYGLAKKYGYTWGQTSSIWSGASWGYAYGAATALLISTEFDAYLGALSMLSFSGAGMFLGNYLYEKNKFTNGDVSIVNYYGGLGLTYPLALLYTFNVDGSEYPRAYLLGGMLGAAGGLLGGIYRTKNYDYTRQQGNLIVTGASSGALFGGAAAILFNANEKATLWLITLGATGGFLTTDYVLREKGISGFRSSNLRLQVNPYGFLGSIKPETNPYKPWDHRYSNSMVNLSYTF
jgi:hypothetical protein